MKSRDYLFDVPLKKLRFIYVFAAITLIFMVARVISSYIIPNKNFYKTAISGEVKHIYETPRSNSYFINGRWYLIKGDCINYIKVNDSIVKLKDSYVLKIIDSDTKRTKYEKLIPYLIFMDAGNGVKPKIPFSQM